MTFEQLTLSDESRIREMSEMATEIVKEHYDPIIGEAQNDYMIGRFQTTGAIRSQLEQGYQYYFVSEGGRRVGFLAFYPKERCMYLSKLYLYKDERGKGYSRKMLDFVVQAARRHGSPAVELNVNRNNSAVRVYEKLGMKAVRCEKIDIGGGFFMDDYVFRLEV